MLLDETLPFCSILDRRSGASYSGNLQWPGCRYLRRFKREAQVCSHQPGELSGVEKIELELAQIAQKQIAGDNHRLESAACVHGISDGVS